MAFCANVEACVVEPRNEGLEFDASILSALAVELALERNPISTCFTEHRSGINTAMFCAANVVSSSADTTQGHCDVLYLPWPRVYAHRVGVVV